MAEHSEFVAENNREGYETHISFLEYNKEDIGTDREIMLEVMDLEDWGRKPVRALVAKEGGEGEGWKDLWIKNLEDKISPEVYKIKILEVYDDEEVKIFRPDIDKEEIGVSLYGSGMTTKKMEQEAADYKKQFGRKGLKKDIGEEKF